MRCCQELKKYRMQSSSGGNQLQPNEDTDICPPKSDERRTQEYQPRRPRLKIHHDGGVWTAVVIATTQGLALRCHSN